MKYRMICMDMDGTLLDDYKNVSPKSKETIKEAAEKGIKIVVCTGRMFTSALFYSDLIGAKTPIIASNGAYIREKDRDEVIYKCILGYDLCKRILNVMKKYDLFPHFNCSDRVLTEKLIHSSLAYKKFNESMPISKQIGIELVKDWEPALKKYEDDILKVIATDKDINKIAMAKKEFMEMGDVEVVSSWNDNFEVMAKGVSKGRAVEVLASYYNIPREEIICIGDNENDISMLKFAGLGVAMGNGADIAKKAADVISDTNNNDGVAKIIEKYML